eukprot:Nitzschia sp. Nitz4//scaffold191_size41780//39658//41064//NITZ4_007478-RA/size41780-augustus-gene-0.65-mRNA-1//1//CDS//3329540214//6588//frame0
MSRKPQLKYKKAPQAPRRFKSSYMFFSTEKHKSIRRDLAEKGEVDKMSTTDVAKMVSQAWKNLSNDEREEWEELARKDKARYEMEKAMYTGPWKVPAKRRSQKDPNAPKRPMSAFLSFSNAKRTEVKDSNPDMGNAEVSRILAQMWKDATEDEKKEHIDKEFKLRQEYKVAIAEWRKTSEDEIQAARKEREDQAMKAVLEGRPVPRMDYQDGDHAYVKGKQQPTYTEYPYGYSENASNDRSHCSRFEPSYAKIPPPASSSYYFPPQYSYPFGHHSGEHAGVGGHHQHPSWSDATTTTTTTSCSMETNSYYGDYGAMAKPSGGHHNTTSIPDSSALPLVNGNYSSTPGGTYFEQYHYHPSQSDGGYYPTNPYIGSSGGEYTTFEPSGYNRGGSASANGGFSR